jgi:hypothetical protein
VPAEDCEGVLIQFPGEEPFLIGHLVRVSDGDVIAFSPLVDEAGDPVYQLGHHFKTQIGYLEEE